MVDRHAHPMVGPASPGKVCVIFATLAGMTEADYESARTHTHTETANGNNASPGQNRQEAFCHTFGKMPALEGSYPRQYDLHILLTFESCFQQNPSNQSVFACLNGTPRRKYETDPAPKR